MRNVDPLDRQWFLRLFVAGIALSISATTAASQDRPDFSGRWILETASQPSADHPKALSIHMVLVRTNVRGESTAPFYREVAVQREFDSGTRSETHLIGVVGGVVSGVAGVERAEVRREHGVKWDGSSLAFESREYARGTSGHRVSTDRREVWTLEPEGRLRVTITQRHSDGSPVMVTLMYRRQAAFPLAGGLQSSKSAGPSWPGARIPGRPGRRSG